LQEVPDMAETMGGYCWYGRFSYRKPSVNTYINPNFKIWL